jgi:hypothetical protein
MRETNRIARAVLGGCLLLGAGCGGGSGGGGTAVRTTPVTGDYATFLAVATDNELVPGDTVTVSNDWGGYFFSLASNVTSVQVSVTGAGGSQGGQSAGGTGGSGTLSLTPAFLTSQSAAGFWVILGEAGRPSAGETGPITNFMSYNGGGAGTDWSNAENLYTHAAGGGGASDVRLAFAGDPTDPHFLIDPCATPASRIAVVGGGGGGTDNGAAFGGGGGGFNAAGSDGTYAPGEFGTGATTIAPGSLNGLFCYGGNGLQDGSEGWAGGGGGGYYGGGSAPAHGGGGGGSGFLLVAAGLAQIISADGVVGANAATNVHGSFTITVN